MANVTLTKMPHEIQVTAIAMLENGKSIRDVGKALKISNDSVIAIKRRGPSNTIEVEQIKKRLPDFQYLDAAEYRRHITNAKLEKASAYQLQGMISLAITTARDMEGFNRPIINIVEVATNIDKLMNESKRRLAALDTSLTSTPDSNEPHAL